MRNNLVSFFTFLPALTLCAPSWVHDIIAKPKQGLYHGKHDIEDVEAFLGIPYAEALVGPLRFQPPVSLDASTCTDWQKMNVIPATSFGPVCHQVHYDSVLGPQNQRETPPQSEDCLTVNVWRPSGTRNNDKLPVMIWLYGGAFSEGGASVPSKLTHPCHEKSSGY